MAQGFKLQDTTPVGRIQINGSINAHADGDLCYEQGYYGIAEGDVDVGGSFRLSIRCVYNMLVPGGTLVGAPLYGPSKPATAIVLTAVAGGGNILLGMVKTALDANNYADFHLMPDNSMGR